jgi:hypothetical protein
MIVVTLHGKLADYISMVIIRNVKHEANSAKFQGNEMLDTELASEWCALILSGVPHRWLRKC